MARRERSLDEIFKIEISSSGEFQGVSYSSNPLC